MYELIVLGLVPGTNIQITFELFTAIVLAIAGTSVVFWYVHRFRALARINLRILALGEHSKHLFINWKNALPPKLQLFK